MTKIMKLSILLLSSFILAGCIKIDMNLEVTSQDKISGDVTLAISEALAVLAESSDSSSLGNGIYEDLPGVRVEQYNENGFTGQKIFFRAVPIEVFSQEESEEGILQIVRDGDYLVTTGNFGLAEEETSEESVDFLAGGLIENIYDSADIKISIKYPGEIVETNGQITGNAITWRPKFGEENEISAKVYAPRGLSLSQYLWTFLLVALLFLLIVLIRYNKLSLRRGFKFNKKASKIIISVSILIAVGAFSFYLGRNASESNSENVSIASLNQIQDIQEPASLRELTEEIEKIPEPIAEESEAKTESKEDDAQPVTTETPEKVEPSIEAATSNACAMDLKCEIGDIGPGGGVVFYDAGEQKSWGRYLEAAPKDLPKNMWCEDSENFLPQPSFETRIGSGKKNTKLMIQHCKKGAALDASNYQTIINGKTYADWFLPSLDESTEMMRINKALPNRTSHWARWSSTEGGTNDAGEGPKARKAWGVWTEHSVYRADIGTQVSLAKSAYHSVRPVRAF